MRQRKGKVLLITPPNVGDRLLPTKPHALGTLILCEVLRREGWECEVLSPGSFDELDKLLARAVPSLVGIVCFTRQRRAAFLAAQHCKANLPGVPVVIGGPHVLGLEKLILESYESCDAVITGEAEEVLPVVVRCLVDGRDLTGVPSVAWRSSEGIVRNPQGRHPDLTRIPYPSYTSDYLRDYAEMSRGGMYFPGIRRMAATQLSRGCNNECIFCANRAIFGRHRTFEPEYVYDSMLRTWADHGVDTFHFVDDDFCGNGERAEELCDLICRGEVAFQWRCSTRAVTLSNSLVRKMAQAGCKMVSFGIESADERVLTEIGKNLSLEEAHSLLAAFRSVGIERRISLTFGYGSETPSTLDKTAAALNEIRPEALAIYLLKVYPGTPLYSKAKHEGFIDDAWWFEYDLDAPLYTQHISALQFADTQQKLIGKLRGAVVREKNMSRDDGEVQMTWR